MTQKFTVSGMSCSACAAHVEKAVRKLPGVSDVAVNLLSGEMTVGFAPEKEDADKICAAGALSGVWRGTKE